MNPAELRRIKILKQMMNQNGFASTARATVLQKQQAIQRFKEENGWSDEDRTPIERKARRPQFTTESHKFYSLTSEAKQAFGSAVEAMSLPSLPLPKGFDRPHFHAKSYRVLGTDVYIKGEVGASVQNEEGDTEYSRSENPVVTFRLTREEAEFTYAVHEATRPREEAPLLLEELFKSLAERIDLDARMNLPRIRQPFYLHAYLKHQDRFAILDYAPEPIRSHYEKFKAEAQRCGLEGTLDLVEDLPAAVMAEDTERNRQRYLKQKEQKAKASQEEALRLAEQIGKHAELGKRVDAVKAKIKEEGDEPDLWVRNSGRHSKATLQIQFEGHSRINLPVNNEVRLNAFVPYSAIRMSRNLHLMIQAGLIEVVTGQGRTTSLELLNAYARPNERWVERHVAEDQQSYLAESQQEYFDRKED